MNVEIGLVLSQLLAFLALLWVMKKWAWRPFLKILQDRTQTIQSAFDAIEEQKKQVQSLADAYTQKLAGIEKMTQAKLDEAIAQGQMQAKQIQDEAQKQAREIIDKAQASIAHELTLAQHKLHDQVVDLVLKTTEKLLEGRLDPEMDKGRVAKFLEEASLK